MVRISIFVITITLAYASGYLVLPHQAHLLQSYNRFANDFTDMGKVRDDDKVNVELYYETFCPGCQAEYADLFSLYTRIGDRINLNTYPYGNARTDGNTVTCQHGEEECYGNKLHACAIDILKDMPKWFKYNACMMSALTRDDSADQCGSEQTIDSGPIKNCAKGDRGQELLIEAGKSTPAHSYVPYVSVNGRVVDSETENLIDEICKAFKQRPSNCMPQSPSHFGLCKSKQ